MPYYLARGPYPVSSCFHRTPVDRDVIPTAANRKIPLAHALALASSRVDVDLPWGRKRRSVVILHYALVGPITLRNEVGIPSMPGKILSNQVVERPLSAVWLVLIRYALPFLGKVVCHKKAWFGHFEPIWAKKDILRQSDWSKNLSLWKETNFIL